VIPIHLLPSAAKNRLDAIMNLRERAAFIDRELDRLYPDPAIPLHHEDPFTLLIAVLLSAQCTDARVNQVTPTLFKLARSPEAMARLPEETILATIRSCGLAPQKASAISRLSKILIDQYKGEVPRSLEELEELPGVGHKTASVVMVQAFDQPAFPVDTHIHRLAQRWRLTSGRSVEQTERDLKRLFPRDRWSTVHLQIIYYGREHCTARGCDATKCPICRVVNAGRKPVKTRK
jgi:endonuclease III